MEISAPAIHSTSAQPASPLIPATSEGVLKMPAPITMPTISATAEKGRSRRSIWTGAWLSGFIWTVQHVAVLVLRFKVG